MEESEGFITGSNALLLTAIFYVSGVLLGKALEFSRGRVMPN